jgi:transcriptional regulator with XRE-family HTH domain
MKQLHGAGKRLRQVRGALTQKEFAEALGVHVVTYRRYEYSERDIHETVLQTIERRYQINRDWLLTGEGPQKTHKVSTELRAVYDLEGDAACSEREMQHLAEDDETDNLFSEERVKNFISTVYGPVKELNTHLHALLNYYPKAAGWLLLSMAENPLESTTIHGLNLKDRGKNKSNSEKFKFDINKIDELLSRILEWSPSDEIHNFEMTKNALTRNPELFMRLVSLHDIIILDSVKNTFQETGISVSCCDDHSRLIDLLGFITHRHSLIELIVIHKAIHDFIVKNPLFSDHVKTMEHPYIDPKALIKSGVLPSSLGIAAQDDEGNGEEGDAAGKD